ncbi:CoA ester lyase [Aeromicrobium sp. YIM 150415]|uniref:HpcH/HpaI aldolase/citrate lyase family protein n=1 Tax=Aeromicrobium sp. YIM 150415 TaxID=2803912 RepID=UPI001963546E|nr:CoA ester lyase [Aeromicrobium sp. YIM 150415]MBM9464032.1 CoA ester lyase [Aeromicrobium sp. YIM 150415]
MTDLHEKATNAVTWLFVPASRPDRFDKALSAGADLVIVDLEDAVDAPEKAAARQNVAELLGRRQDIIVRINARATPWFEEDCSLVSEIACGVMLPKTEGADDLRLVRARSEGTVVIGLIETAHGVLNAPGIASAATRLAFGNADLAAELGVAPDDREALAWSRGGVVAASAAHRLPGPIDGVTLRMDDPGLVLSDAEDARRHGFGGKLCIHPAQLSTVTEAFSPTDEELRWALSVASTGDGVSSVDGIMVDAPVKARAERLLLRAGLDISGHPDPQ